MKSCRSAFYSVFFFSLLIGVGIMIGLFYELDSRGSKSGEHYYQQLRFYDDGVVLLAKACLRRYSFDECKSLKFALGRYEILLEMREEDPQTILLDSLIQTQDLLSGRLLRKVSRRVLILSSP